MATAMLRNELARKLKSGNNKAIWMGLGFNSLRGISTSTPDIFKNGGNTRRIDVPAYTVFKGKSALLVTPVMPTFTKLDSGFSRIERKGVVLLTFMPAIGLRKYDFEKKQMFALSPTEVGSLISLGPAESAEFLHDPSMKSSLEGQVKKNLVVVPLSSDNSGYFFNLNVTNTVAKTSERFSVPVSKAEFAVMRTAFSYVLPQLMGWDVATRPPQVGNVGHGRSKPPETSPRPDLEWFR